MESYPTAERFNDDLAAATVTPGDWTTSPRMLALLDREGTDAWQAHINKQLTRKQIAKLDPVALMQAQADGKLDRISSGG